MNRRAIALTAGLLFLLFALLYAYGSDRLRPPPTTPVVATQSPVADALPTATAAVTATTAAASAPAVPTPPAQSDVPRYGYQIVNVWPHDSSSFTQGLVYQDGVFYESGGRYEASTLRRVDPESGQVLEKVDVPREYFAEGLTLWQDKLIQLTWREQTGFVYDQATLAQTGVFTYPTEGWGITHDGTHRIVSDGTPIIYFWDPETFTESSRITVTYQGQPVAPINELEYVNGEIFANLWQSDLIVRIDPATGNITGIIELPGLLQTAPAGQTPVDVLNGIAYDPAGDRLFVTGKWWPWLFEIDLVPLPAPAQP
jgi:glutamine cyclotransferase